MPDTLSSSDLMGLIERLEKATGPDRDTDQDLFDVVHLGIARREEALPHCPRYTSSLAAALSLVERKLPGWQWHCGHSTLLGPGYFSAMVAAPDVRLVESEERDDEFAACARSPAIALLIALLKALQP